MIFLLLCCISLIQIVFSSNGLMITNTLDKNSQEEIKNWIWSYNQSNESKNIQTENEKRQSLLIMPDELTRKISNHIQMDLSLKWTGFLAAPSMFSIPDELVFNKEFIFDLYIHLYDFKQDNFWEMLGQLPEHRKYHFVYNILRLMSKAQKLKIMYHPYLDQFFQDILQIAQEKKVQLKCVHSLIIDQIPASILIQTLTNLGIQYHKLTNLTISFLDGFHKSFKSKIHLETQIFDRISENLNALIDLEINVAVFGDVLDIDYCYVVWRFLHNSWNLKRLQISPILLDTINKRLNFDAGQQLQFISRLTQYKNLETLRLISIMFPSSEASKGYEYILALLKNKQHLKHLIIRSLGPHFKSPHIVDAMIVLKNLEQLETLQIEGAFKNTGYEAFCLWRSVLFMKSKLQILKPDYSLLKSILSASKNEINSLIDDVTNMYNLQELSIIQNVYEHQNNIKTGQFILALLTNKPKLKVLNVFHCLFNIGYVLSIKKYQNLIHNLKSLNQLEELRLIYDVDSGLPTQMEILNALITNKPKLLHFRFHSPFWINNNNQENIQMWNKFLELLGSLHKLRYFEWAYNYFPLEKLFTIFSFLDKNSIQHINAIGNEITASHEDMNKLVTILNNMKNLKNISLDLEEKHKKYFDGLSKYEINYIHC